MSHSQPHPHARNNEGKRWEKSKGGGVTYSSWSCIKLEKRKLLELPQKLLFYITGQKEQNEIPLSFILSSCSNCFVFCLEADSPDVYEKWISRLLGDLFSGWLFFGLLLLKWTIRQMNTGCVTRRDKCCVNETWFSDQATDLWIFVVVVVVKKAAMAASSTLISLNRFLPFISHRLCLVF